MSKDLKIQVQLSAIDKLTAPFKNAQKVTQTLSSTLWQNKDKLRDLSREYNHNESQIKKYRDTLNPLKAKLTENTSALSKAYAEVRRMENAMGKMKAPTEGFSKKLNEARKNVEKLKNEQTKTVNKLRDARNEFRKNGFSASQMGQSQQALRNAMRGTNKEIDLQREKLARLNNKAQQRNIYRQRVDGLRTKAEQYANIGGRALTTYSMMKDKVAQPVSTFAQAEVAITNLKVAMMDKNGNVSAEFEKINALAMQLGDKLPGTTADFQDLMTMLIRQGMSVETILGGTGEAAAYLSVQLEMPPKQAAEFAAKMQDATRTTEADMMGLMDVIQKGFYAGVDPTNMLGAFKNLGAAMDTIKIKGLEGAKVFAPFVAMFDQAGMEGTSQGNAMRKVLQKGMDTAKIKKALLDLKGDKLLPKNFNLDFTDGKGEFGGFDNLFKQLEKLKTLTTEAREAVIKEVFGNDAEVHMVISTLIEKGKAGYEEFAEKIERQAELRRRVDEQLNTLTNIWEAATGTFTNLLVEIGATIAPQLKELAKELGDIAEKVKDWVKANPELTGSLMKIAVILTGVIGITGALTSAFSFLLFPIGRTILFLGSFGRALISIIPSVLAFSAALLTNPMTWIVLGVMALITALVLLVKNWDTVKEKLIAGWNWLSEQASEIWQNISNAVIEKWESLKTNVGEITDKIGQFFTEKWNGIVDTAKNFGSNLMTKVKDGILDTFKDVKQAITDSVNWIKQKLGFSSEAEQKIEDIKQKAEKATANAMNNSAAGVYYMQSGVDTTGQWQIAQDSVSKAKVITGKANGGYVGNGGKYQPMGVVHGGEYVMTKEATSRLGVATLNALNYGKQALIAGGVGISVATAAPVQVDHRPPITPQNTIAQPQQPMQVNITINAQSGQDERAIARLVAQELQRIQNQQQARVRNSLRDRD